MNFTYFAGDVEGSMGRDAAGNYTLPPVASMVSTGLVLVGNPDVRFYAELLELPGAGWDPESEKIHKLSRTHLRRNGEDPKRVMEAVRRWVLAHSGEAVPVYCAMPVGYDFGHMDWYFRNFGVQNPFSKKLDGREHYRRLRGLPARTEVDRMKMWAEFPPTLPHTHNALDDALEYEEVVRQMLREEGAL